MENEIAYLGVRSNMNNSNLPVDDLGAMPEKSGYPWLTAYPAGISWNAALQPTSVHLLLEQSANKYPNRTCTDFLGKCLTYSNISRLVDRAACGLQQIGVKKGTKVGLFLPNSPTFIIFYYATLKAGGVVVNFNPLYTVEELTFQVEDSETDVMVTLDLKLLFDKVEALIEQGPLKRAIVCSFPALLPSFKSTLYKLLKGNDLAKPKAARIADKLIFEEQIFANDGRVDVPSITPEEDLAVLQYTGGTTGTPKGAMLTHAAVSCNVQQLAAWAPELKPGEERMMGILPFFHVFAMTVVMNFGVATAAELIIVPKFELDQAMKLINKTKPTVMPGVPTLFNAIMNYPKLSSVDLSSLKFCLSGGAPLPLEIKRGFEGLTGCKLVEGYGLSETSPVATANPLEGPVKEGSIGQPVPGTILSIRELGNPEHEMALGENGEICIAGPQVMKGYWKRPKETSDVFIGEFLRTGDVGYMDDEGFTFIVDRLKDLIICSGYNVYPRRIEEAIYEFPAVEEVTVIGIADEYRGEAPKAFVKLKDGHTATIEDIFKFLEPKISKIEMPAEIEFRDELPKTMIGKLSKKELKQEEVERKGR